MASSFVDYHFSDCFRVGDMFAIVLPLTFFVAKVDTPTIINFALNIKRSVFKLK